MTHKQGLLMVSQDNLDRMSTTEKSALGVSSKGVAYVLDMLGELLAVAELSGHQKLSDDIQAVIDTHAG